MKFQQLESLCLGPGSLKLFATERITVLSYHSPFRSCKSNGTETLHMLKGGARL